MRRTAPVFLMVVVGLISGCSTMGSRHPGISEPSPGAVTREFPSTATQMAQVMTDVMASDPILDNVSMTPDGGREFRNFSRADRARLGISLLTPANDVNYNIQAKSKDGHPVAVAVRLKGESSCEISVLYGSQGDDGLSKDLLDKAQLALASAAKDTAVTRTASTKASAERVRKP